MGVAVKFLVITSKKITGNYPVITNPVFALLPAVNYQPRNPKLPPRAPSFSHFFFGGKERFSPGEAGCNACPSRHAKQALHHVQMPVRGERAARLQQLPHTRAACEDGGGQGHAAVLRRAGPRAAWLADEDRGATSHGNNLILYV